MSANSSKPSHLRRQIWLGVVAALFLCDFVLCGYLPLQQRLASLKQARAEQRRTIQMAATQGAELARLKARLRDKERLVERFDASIPPDKALSGFLRHVNGMMEECDLADPFVLPDKEFEAAGLRCIPIHMTCRGSLAQLFGFFDRLRSLDRLVRIEKVMIGNGATYAGRLSLQADVILFYQPSRLRTNDDQRAQSFGKVSYGA